MILDWRGTVKGQGNCHLDALLASQVDLVSTHEVRENADNQSCQVAYKDRFLGFVLGETFSLVL